MKNLFIGLVVSLASSFALGATEIRIHKERSSEAGFPAFYLELQGQKLVADDDSVAVRDILRDVCWRAEVRPHCRDDKGALLPSDLLVDNFRLRNGFSARVNLSDYRLKAFDNKKGVFLPLPVLVATTGTVSALGMSGQVVPTSASAGVRPTSTAITATAPVPQAAVAQSAASAPTTSAPPSTAATSPVTGGSANLVPLATPVAAAPASAMTAEEVRMIVREAADKAKLQATTNLREQLALQDKAITERLDQMRSATRDDVKKELQRQVDEIGRQRQAASTALEKSLKEVATAKAGLDTEVAKLPATAKAAATAAVQPFMAEFNGEVVKFKGEVNQRVEAIEGRVQTGSRWLYGLVALALALASLALWFGRTARLRAVVAEEVAPMKKDVGDLKSVTGLDKRQIDANLERDLLKLRINDELDVTVTRGDGTKVKLHLKKVTDESVTVSGIRGHRSANFVYIDKRLRRLIEQADVARKLEGIIPDGDVDENEPVPILRSA